MGRRKTCRRVPRSAREESALKRRRQRAGNRRRRRRHPRQADTCQTWSTVAHSTICDSRLGLNKPTSSGRVLLDRRPRHCSSEIGRLCSVAGRISGGFSRSRQSIGDADLAYLVPSGSRCFYLVSTAVTVRSSSSSGAIITVAPRAQTINTDAVVMVVITRVCLAPQLWSDQNARFFRVIRTTATAQPLTSLSARNNIHLINVNVLKH